MEKKHEIKMVMTTDSILAPEQIIGEAFDDYIENHKIQNLSIFIAKIKEVK